jgi:hypothetical protein
MSRAGAFAGEVRGPQRRGAIDPARQYERVVHVVARNLGGELAPGFAVAMQRFDRLHIDRQGALGMRGRDR